jgi:hypothetical protein
VTGGPLKIDNLVQESGERRDLVRLDAEGHLSDDHATGLVQGAEQVPGVRPAQGGAHRLAIHSPAPGAPGGDLVPVPAASLTRAR